MFKKSLTTTIRNLPMWYTPMLAAMFAVDGMDTKKYTEHGKEIPFRRRSMPKVRYDLICHSMWQKD